MIEHLRKYTGLIIVIIVLVLIGFLFMDTSSIRASQGGAPYLKVEGRNYTDKEYRKIGSTAYELTQSLMQSGDFSLYPFLITLAGNAKSQEQAEENFFTNRILLRSAKEEFGVYPGAEEIDSFIRKLRAFTGPDGAFSQEQYRNFIEKRIGRLGLTEGDLRELVSDILTQEKLADILGSGLSTNPEVLAKTIALDSQRISVNVARIDIDPIEAKIEPSDQEIKLYWETVQDAFKTPEKRKFTYLTAKPVEVEVPAEIPAPAADATDEAKAEYETKKADREATLTDIRRKAQLKADAKVDNFLYMLESQKNLSFDKLAEEDGWELKTTELFALSEAPDELNAPLRSSSSRGIAADELFRMQVTADPFSKISPAIAIGENEWLIARLEETVEVRVQTFDEARAEARARLIADKAAAGLTKAAEKANQDIKAAVAEGKTFDEAAKAAGMTNETVSLPEITSSYQGDTTKIPSNLFDAAKHINPGSLSEPVIESDRAFIVHVVSREVVKQENAQATVEARVQSATERNKLTAFSSWLDAKSVAADIQQLYRQ
ncbi:MAG: SurA N-terminal domain-containing protein [Verrucomicrobia bacterium]|jgi:hypothetical protein|nr:SurA N-terminal domain-containing protein [Verrucomicrobiota bacterium]|tara:strand:- start:45798 stop:47441 length:1644 start_codon:yes stop_codon:yes gene_type:complete